MSHLFPIYALYNSLPLYELIQICDVSAAVRCYLNISTTVYRSVYGKILLYK